MENGQRNLKHDEHSKLTRKMFSEKPIVTFTNSTVFILDFYI